MNILLANEKHIEYAKTKSYATLQREDPNFVHPALSKKPPSESILSNGLISEKRAREDGDGEDERDRKREKGEDEGEEMEIEEDDKPGSGQDG